MPRLRTIATGSLPRSICCSRGSDCLFADVSYSKTGIVPISGGGQAFRDDALALSDNARDAARLVARRLHLVLEVAARGDARVAWAQVGPGAAALVGVAKGLAGKSA